MTSDNATVEINSLSNEKLLEYGRKSLACQKAAEAVDAFSLLAERMTAEHNGDQLHPSLGDIWFLYGRACYLNATLNIDILNQEAMPPVDNSAIAGAGAEDSKKGRFVFEDEGADDDDENWEDADGEQDEDDEDGPDADDISNEFQMAWEALETARIIFSSQTDKNSQLQLAEVHRALGEMQLDEGKFLEAILDLRKNLEIKLRVLPPHDRLVSEAQYILAIALESVEEYEESLVILREALSGINLRQQLLKESLTSDGKVDESGKGKFTLAEEMSPDQMKQELSDLELLVPDLEARILDFQQLLDKKKSEAVALDDTATKEDDSAIPSVKLPPSFVPKVMDISSLVKKKPVASGAGEKRVLDDAGSNEQDLKKKVKAEEA